MRNLIAVVVAAFVLGLIMGSQQQPSQLPAGFSVRHADGVTYVCSQHPVFCTGNAPVKP